MIRNSISKIFSFFLFIIFLFNLFISQLEAQNIVVKREFVFQNVKDSLWHYKKFETNKLLINQIKLPALVELSYYSELELVSIEFKKKRIKTTMAAFPKMGSVFRKKQNRKYIIVINKDSVKIKNRYFNDFPFNAQIGIIAHELSHITTYNELSSFQIVSYGIRYLFGNQRRKIEHETDLIVLEHGLGWQLYDFSNFIYSNVTDNKYLEYKKKYYFSPNQIYDILIDTKK